MSGLITTLRSIFTPETGKEGTLPVPKDRRMDLHSGAPFWAGRHALPPYPELHEDIRTDVVIVGGGITGALCAYTFSRAGMATVVVDARPIGMGSTCASTALLQYEIDTPLHQLVDMVGEKDAVRSYQLCAQAVDRLGEIAVEIGASGFTKRSSVQYASKRAHVSALVKEHAMRSAHGLPCSLLDSADDIRSALGFEAPGALRTDVAAEMDALGFTHALHEKSRESGVRVFQNTTIAEFRDNGSGIELRTIDGRAIRAQQLVYATGYESRDHLPKDVIQLNSTYAMVTKPRTGVVPWPEEALIWETASPYLYLRTAPEGRVIIGGRDERFRSPKLRDRLLDMKAKALEKDLLELYPGTNYELDAAWCGTFGSTKDGLPYIDNHPREYRSFYALGMGGNGITFSVIAAEMIRDWILGRPNSDAGIFRFDR